MINYTILYFGGNLCRACGSVTEQLDRLPPNIHVEKYDIAQNIDKAMANGVIQIPTLVLIKNGTDIGKIVGAVTAEEIINKFNSQ